MSIMEEALGRILGRLDMRLGQAIYNVAHERNPRAASKLIATHLDPFHDDKLIPAFLEAYDRLTR